MTKLFLKTLIIIMFTGFAKFASAQQWDGLTYYSTIGSTLGYLLDTNSTVVKTWNFTGNTAYAGHMVPGGSLFRTVSIPGNPLTGGGMHGRIQKVDYNGAILWDYTYSSPTYCMHHDHYPMANGNVLVISYDVKTATEVAAAGGSLNVTVWSEKVMELKPVGTNGAIVVWEWKLWDHLVQNVDPNKANYQASIVNNPQLLNINYKLVKDLVHMNGIDYNPVLDQIVVSSHALNEWYIIDHSTTTAEAASHAGGFAGKGGDFLYRWGNPIVYGATGTKILNVTHDAHWIPADCPNGGNLAGINNMGATNPNKTTCDQANVPRVNYNYSLMQGSAYSPTTFSSRQITTGYTTNMGSVQEFPNGNQLICLATIGTIYEINSAGATLWTKSTGSSTPQSERRSLCYITNPAPVQPTITASGNMLSTATASLYQWYFNGNILTGATAQTYSATQTGTYVVQTTDVNGCVNVYSSSFSHSVTSQPGTDTGIDENAVLLSVTIFPNPSNGSLEIDIKNSAVGDYTLNLLDLTGKVMISAQNQDKLDLSQLNNGLYILNITTPEGKSVNKKITLVK